MLGGHGYVGTLLGNDDRADRVETCLNHLFTTSAGDSLGITTQLLAIGDFADGADEAEVALLLFTHLDRADLLGNCFLTSLEVGDGTLYTFHLFLQSLNIGVVHLGLLYIFVFLVLVVHRI